MEPNNTPITIETDALTCICVIGNIQLATRHQRNIGPSKQIAEVFARKLQQAVAEKHPEFAAVMEMGWNPTLDISEQ